MPNMRWIWPLALLTLALGCERASPPADGGAPSAAPSSPPRGPAAIAHGGAGSPAARSQQVLPAVRRALERVRDGADALEAAVEGAVVLENDPSFNAGTGANVRFDGRSVQMDAAVMSSDGRFGAVAVIERVKNPVRVARAVMDTPHTLLAGDGATAFARAFGFADYDPATDEARARRDRAVDVLFGKVDGSALPPGWQSFDWRRHYDQQQKLRDAGLERTDTIGVVVRAADGSFAGALSTGGTTLTLRGRVGDVPLQGAGLFVGAKGAVAATGNGEDIVRVNLARRVYDELARGQSAARAVELGVGLFDQQIPIGLIAIDGQSEAAASNREMAWAAVGPAGERLAGAK
jgi:L-asparaginase / beta-aspartyl-peptidase